MVRLTFSEYDRNKKVVEEPKEDVPKYAKSEGNFIIEVIKIIVITLAIVIPIRYFLFQPYYVQGASMEPNFYNNQYLLVDEITYRLSTPQRGDVVVLKIPIEQDALIKRIIGLPGETVEIKNDQVEIFNSTHPNGYILSEPYLGPNIYTSGNISVTLASDQYYVLGDNRPVSLDSRYFGAITKKEIIGRAWLRVFPFNTFQHFVSPSYANWFSLIKKQP